MARRGKLSIIYPAQACEPEVAAKLNEWISGIARVYPCRALHVVEVDRYFSVKWLHFSGKALGALGISKKTTTIPPFIPSRVLRERRFLLRGPWAPYEDKPGGYRLHIWQTSSSNLQRIAARVAPDVALVWYGGGSATEGQAGFMAYIPLSDAKYWCWYAGLRRGDNWSVDRLKGIHPRDLAYIEAHGKPNVFGPVPKKTPRGWR
jgi:hypothetical protein